MYVWPSVNDSLVLYFVPGNLFVCLIGVGAGTFSGVQRIFAQISCPKNTPKKMTSKKVCTLILGVTLQNQSTYSVFAKVFKHFAQISTAWFLSDFPQIFTKSEVLGVHLHSRLLHQWSVLHFTIALFVAFDASTACLEAGPSAGGSGAPILPV